MCMGLFGIIFLEFFTKNLKDIWKYSLFRDKEIKAQNLVAYMLASNRREFQFKAKPSSDS